MGLKLSITIPSIDQFYAECDIVEPTGDQQEWNKCNTEENPGWIGITQKEAAETKYCYKKGLDLLKEIELDTQLGGSKKLYKWDNDDGDDMSLDRLYDDMPAMRKRLKTLGKGNGKFITIYASVGENACVSYKDMLNRAYTVIQVIDYLENQGFRVAVIVYEDVGNPGTYKGERIDLLHLEIVIKKAEEPLNKGLILSCISPWFLRIHIFKFWNAKFKMGRGYGHSVHNDYINTEDTLYFKTGSCLNKADSDNYLNQFMKKMEKSDE